MAKKPKKKSAKKPAKRPAKRAVKKAIKIPKKAQPGKPAAPQHPRAEIEINTDWCKGCYICVDICPKSVFGKSAKLSKSKIYPAKVERLAQCILCRECESHCPDLAITVEQKAK